MKTTVLTRLVPALAAGFLLATPSASLAKHKHRNHCSSGRSVVYVSSGYGYGGGYGSPYSYGYSRPYYGSYASSYCAPRHYYPRTSIGFSLFTTPRYYSSYGSSRYYPSSSYVRYSSRASSYSDELAVDVQRALRRNGYYGGSIDGDIGPGSRAAIRAYQRDRGLPVTGRIDSSLLRALRIT